MDVFAQTYDIELTWGQSYYYICIYEQFLRNFALISHSQLCDSANLHEKCN